MGRLKVWSLVDLGEKYKCIYVFRILFNKFFRSFLFVRGIYNFLYNLSYVVKLVDFEFEMIDICYIF